MTQQAGEPEPEPGRPEPGTIVLRGRTLRPGCGPVRLSRFADDVWDLRAAHPDVHLTGMSLIWAAFPRPLAEAFKMFALAVLDNPRPPGPFRTGNARGRPSIVTLREWTGGLRPFAHWIDDRAVAEISAVTSSDLDAYLMHVRALDRSPRRKANLLTAVRMLWVYRDHLPGECRLPAGPPWGLSTAGTLTGAGPKGRFNRTPRIAAETMESLLAWALCLVEDAGPDIRDAWQEYSSLRSGTHPVQTLYAHLPARPRLESYLADLRRVGGTLPGEYRNGKLDPNISHLSRLLSCHHSRIAEIEQRHETISRSGIPLDLPRAGAITGRIAGQPWRAEPIPYRQAPVLLGHLTTACFVVICYLSGMRPGEVLNLRRGCGVVHPATGELMINGRRGKGTDTDPPPGVPAASAAGPDMRSWVVVRPVHTAVAMLESIACGDLLFPAGLRRAGSRAGNAEGLAGKALARDLQRLIAWVNESFRLPGAGTPVPSDPLKNIHPARFRRTLAYFIVRRPRGLIACALQYGHVSTKVTLSYAGAADTGWMDDVAVERLEMVVEQLGDDWDRLDAGEHVSGPSAAEYRARIERMAPFAGRVVAAVRGAERLLASTDPDVHHGEGMTCVHRAETAECRKVLMAQGRPVDGPDESECRSSCQNLAYTDRDIVMLQQRLTVLRNGTADPLSPMPLRSRLQAQADQLQEIIERHDNSRSAQSRAGQEQERQ
jgi:integrase